MPQLRLAITVVLLSACVQPTPTTSIAPTAGQRSSIPAVPSPLASMPTPRTHLAKAVIEGAVFAIGGLGRGGTRLATVERFDLISRSWKQAIDLPLPLDHAMAGAVEGEVIVVGGVYAQGSSRGFRLDSAGGPWREISPMPVARAAGAATVLDGLLYVVGGVGSDTHHDGSTRVFTYDPTADRWSETAPMSTPRQHLAVVTYQGRVCAVGGRGPGASSGECYDPSADRWERLPDLAAPEEDFDAVVVEGKIWTFGPHGVQVFDGARWRLVREIASPGFGGVAVASGRTVYLLGWSDGGVFQVQLP